MSIFILAPEKNSMIKRIVKLSFAPEHVPAFRQIFEESQPLILRFPGCQHLELWQEAGAEHILFTVSHWESEAALEAYRHSELFVGTWARTKALFADKPAAWSLVLVEGSL